MPYHLQSSIPTPPPENFKVEEEITQFLFAPACWELSDGLMYNDITKQWARYDGAAVTEMEILRHVLERAPGHSELVPQSHVARGY